MVKRQRGKSASLLKRGENKKSTEGIKLVVESSDEDAPEEVTFEESKSQAFKILKQAVESARREKEQLREKRRKRQEFFQEQKKKKLLSADVLEKIDSTPLDEQKTSEDEAEEEALEEDDDNEEEEGSTNRKGRKLSGVRSLKGNYTVTTVKEREAADFQRQEAEDFIRFRLYGAGTCRSTNNEMLSLQNKRGPNKRAALQFVKKGWACKKKAKAEKLNKRWIQKQQVPSS